MSTPSRMAHWHFNALALNASARSDDEANNGYAVVKKIVTDVSVAE